MAKEKKNQKKQNTSHNKGDKAGLLPVVVFVLVVAGLVYGGYTYITTPEPGQGRSFFVLGGENKPLLDPLLMPGRNARLAYMAAHKYPQLMDKIFCYCGCDQAPNNHKSLLSCYTDRHGVT